MASEGYVLATIKENILIHNGVYKMTVEGDFRGKPGQFYMFRSWDLDPLLSRPFSICDITKDGIVFLYQVVGKGTKQMSEMGQGSKCQLLGPLGNGFEINENYSKTALISGGIGLAPMYFLAKELKCQVDLYAGFSDEPYFIEEMGKVINDLRCASDKGLAGKKGNVLSILDESIEEYDQIFACGPEPMLAAIKDKIDGNKLQLSLENHMACGFGICLGCAVETTQGIKRCCVEGPVFKGSELI